MIFAKSPSLRWFHVVAFAAFSLISCKEEEQKAPPPPPAVKVAEVITRDVPIAVEAVGQTRGNTEIEISARVEGFLETMEFKEGTFVKKGQRLYTIDDKPFRAALAEAVASLEQAKAELVRKHQDVERYKPLVEKNAVSRQEYETAVAQEKAQESAVAAAQAGAQKAQVELGYTKVVAPDDGLIGTTEAHPGTLVGTAQKPLLTRISKIDPIHVRFSISERDYLFYAKRRHAKGLKDEGPDGRAAESGLDAGAKDGAKKVRGAKAGGSPDAGVPPASDEASEFQLILADGSVHPYGGTLVFVDRNVDAKTGTILLEASFPNPNNIVRPGQFAKIRANASIKKGATLISQKSVQDLQGISNVVVVKDDGSVEARPVKLAERVGDLAVVESGVKPGERIVIEGLQKIRPGIKVKPELVPLEEPSPSPAGSVPSGAAEVAAPAASGG